MSVEITPESLPARFYLDMAIGTQSFVDVCLAYSLDADEVKKWEQDPVFCQRLAVANQAVIDDGRAFRARCKSLVHDALPHMEQLLRDPATPPSVQLDSFKTLVKFSGMEPEPKSRPVNSEQTFAPTLSLTIVAPEGVSSAPQTLTVYPEPDLPELEYAREEDEIGADLGTLFGVAK
jgi:hypothetical protein